ncbi:MAG TPA: HAD-IA family hydrolase [Candidatus Limnocylindrales bacterium]|nr:HAD-IA family hydrolase [Candidatus Limnocylindrales bacterium]
MTIKAVFFDAAGTLIKPARSVGESYAAIAAKHGKEVSSTNITERFRTCFDAAPRLAFPSATEDTVAALERDWWKSLVAQVFEPWSPFVRFEEYFAELFAYFASPNAWTLYPEVLETLTSLKERDLILDVISNFDSRLVRILDGLGAGAQFENIFVSSRVGYAKPDGRIFNVALSYHGLAPVQALHVGDSEINDLRGANQAGLKGILVERGKTSAAQASDRIDSLRSILALLDD